MFSQNREHIQKKKLTLLEDQYKIFRFIQNLKILLYT